MTKSEVFFGIINPLFQDHIKNIKLSDLEKLSMQTKIFDIFQTNNELDDIYHELLEYLTDDLRLNPLIDSLDQHYQQFNQLN